ncbi:MAG TPA: DJ-1/PfpI family protein [Burkholderiaceae bacterium]|nr:DJ-1/PfpI family protein [Burkholderiaceae bacterium]
MRLGHLLAAGGAVAALALAGFGIWIVSLPDAPAPPAAPPLADGEARATIVALKPPKRVRPLIAVIGINDATEVTDYLMSYGILKRADVADVIALATRPGPVRLYPALTVQPQATVTDFDARHPDGADYVIVPAMSRDDDPAALEWIRGQASKGAIIIGVCAGAKVVGATGLLDGRRATTHWYFVNALRDAHPGIRLVADRRLVVDRPVATTTGITASMPMMLTLIEAIAGRDKAAAVGRELGVAGWDARHDSAAFRFNRPFAVTVLGNLLTFWKRERFGIGLEPGVDEVSLALVADAWSRTYRSRAVTFAGTADPIESRYGIRIIPEQVAADWPAGRRLAIDDRPPAQALDQTLQAITDRYGGRTTDVVAMQLEYPRHAAQPPASR